MRGILLDGIEPGEIVVLYGTWVKIKDWERVTLTPMLQSQFLVVTPPSSLAI